MDKKRDARAKLLFCLSQLLLSFAVLVVATVVVAQAPLTIIANGSAKRKRKADEAALYN